MVEVTDSLKCLFTGAVEEDGDDGYVIRVPNREVDLETVREGETYRVVVMERADPGDGDADATAGATTVANGSGATSSSGSARSGSTGRSGTNSGPPVDEGDVRDVTIETLGDQGDGIAKIERGYVIIVPDADLGDEVTVEITSVRENVSFARVIDD